MKLKGFLKALDHRLSPSSVQFLDSAGFLDIDSASYYADYATVNGSYTELIACEPDVFINSKEREDHNWSLLIIANKKRKRFVSVVFFSAKEGIVSIPVEHIHQDIVDLSDSGERWEGDVYDGYPCGWGRYFNDDNVLCYEGFRYKEDTVCYGTSYYSDLLPECKCYSGMISFDLRCGKGTEYCRNGAVLYTGYWMSNKQLSENTVVVPANTKMQLYHNTLMSGFVVQEHSYPNLLVFSLVSYPFLETVDIAASCFDGEPPTADTQRDYPIPGIRNYSTSIRRNNSTPGMHSGYATSGMHSDYATQSINNAPFSIAYCDVLREVSIGGHSFSHFTSFALTHLPALRRLRVAVAESSAFPSCHVFRLEACPLLEDVRIGDGCFQKARSVVLRELPALARVQVGEASFEGDETNTHLSLVLKNKLVLQNLPSLQRFVGTHRNFQFFGEVLISGRGFSL